MRSEQDPNQENEQPESQQPQRPAGHGRRDFLRLTAGSALALTMSNLLSGCGGGDGGPDVSPTATPTGTASGTATPSGTAVATATPSVRNTDLFVSTFLGGTVKRFSAAGATLKATITTGTGPLTWRLGLAGCG